MCFLETREKCLSSVTKNPLINTPENTLQLREKSVSILITSIFFWETKKHHNSSFLQAIANKRNPQKLSEFYWNLQKDSC